MVLMIQHAAQLTGRCLIHYCQKSQQLDSSLPQDGIWSTVKYGILFSVKKYSSRALIKEIGRFSLSEIFFYTLKLIYPLVNETKLKFGSVSLFRNIKLTPGAE